MASPHLLRTERLRARDQEQNLSVALRHSGESEKKPSEDPVHYSQQAEHMEAAFKELTRSLDALQARVQFLATRSNKTNDDSLGMVTGIKTETLLKSEENENAIKLLTVAEEKLGPEMTSLDQSLKALNGTIGTISTNLEVADKLDKLEKRMDSANGIFALLQPELKKIKKRVDTIDGHLAGNFTTVLASIVDDEANKFLADNLHNTTKFVRDFNWTRGNATQSNATQSNSTQSNATRPNATNSE